jgi:hypothetical protein
MIYKIISFNSGNKLFGQYDCTQNNKELAFNFYNLGTTAYYSQANDDHSTHWIKLASIDYNIEESFFILLNLG